MPERLTIACIWVAGLFEAAEEGIKHAPTLAAKMPDFPFAEIWGFVPLFFLTVGLVAWGISRISGTTQKSGRDQELIDILEQRLRLTHEREQAAINAGKQTEEKLASFQKLLSIGAPSHEITNGMASVKTSLTETRRLQERVMGTIQVGEGFGIVIKGPDVKI